MTTGIITDIRQELERQADEKTLASAQRYFKEKVVFYGVKTALVGEIARVHFPAVKPMGKKFVFALCEELLKSGYLEESFIACEWAYRLCKEYEPDDFTAFQRWIEKYISNWATCDTLCNHTVGAIVEKYPQFLADLKRWAHSNNRWFRRASAVTLVLPARRGKFLTDILEIADILLLDKDDLVQKGYGWMLKEASKPYLQAVFNYVMEHKESMPRIALRYAIEKMPPDLKRLAMQK